MCLDIKKIDDRISKLQEVRRIASDPEMLKVLAEFLTTDGERDERLPEPRPSMELPITQTGDFSELDDVVRGVLEATGSESNRGSDDRTVAFSRRRV